MKAGDYIVHIGIDIEKAESPYEVKKKLIRCRDCIFWWESQELCANVKCCGKGDCAVSCGPDHYCGYAEPSR